jgi:hypothetical protein
MNSNAVAAQDNNHVYEYLDWYCSTEKALGYAIMLRGPWGSGKTHLIKKFIKTREESGSKHLYVSLYGVTSTRQIEDAFFQQLHPILSSKGMKIASQITKGFLRGVLKIDIDGDGKEDASINVQVPEINLGDYLTNTQDRLLIFDDLERCSMEVSDVLGYINYFVEHEDYKAIILANEADILKRGDDVYRKIKEKLIGQTLEVAANLDEALSDFLDGVTDNKTRIFLKNNKQEITAIFGQSDTNNLRLLRQSIWDFERIAACFEDKHWRNEQAIREAFRVFFALSLETKAGRLDEGDIPSVMGSSFSRYVRSKKNEEPSRADEAADRYPEAGFDNSLLSINVLSDILFRGLVREQAVRASLNEHSHFAEPGTEPAWRAAWHGFERSDDELERALAQVEEQFEKRLFSETGEMLHVFGLRLHFSKIGALTISTQEVVEQSKLYIDDLLREGQLAQIYERLDFSDLGLGWGGSGSWNVSLLSSARFSPT